MSGYNIEPNIENDSRISWEAFVDFIKTKKGNINNNAGWQSCAVGKFALSLGYKSGDVYDVATTLKKQAGLPVDAAQGWDIPEGLDGKAYNYAALYLKLNKSEFKSYTTLKNWLHQKGL